MRRTDDHRFHDLIKGRLWTAEELVSQYQQLPSMWRDHVRSDDVLVEELVECRGRPSYDWKVYAFRGEIALIVQMDGLGGTKRLRCYLPDWSPAHHVFEGRYDRSDPLDSPAMPDELLRAASTLSSILPIPFVRADLYASDNQVLVGELTPFPGTAHEHSPTWDRILGEAWERGRPRCAPPACRATNCPNRRHRCRRAEPAQQVSARHRAHKSLSA